MPVTKTLTWFGLTVALALGATFSPTAPQAWAGVDINTADAAALETLPGIGETKAAAIIQYRTDHGPFKTVDELDNVSGIGPSTMASIHDLVSVTAGAKPQSAESATSPKATTGTTASATGESTASAVSGSAGCPVNINTSDASGLMNLPGIGDSKAAAIVQYRTDHGNFATCDALDAVSGIGPATLQNFAGCCTVK